MMLNLDLINVTKKNCSVFLSWFNISVIKGKEKLSLCLIKHQAMKTYSSTSLDLCTKWRWVVSFTPWPLYSRGNSPPPGVFVGLEAAWAPELVWMLWGGKNLFPLPGIEPWPSSLSLYRLSYPGPYFSYALINKSIFSALLGQRPGRDGPIYGPVFIYSFTTEPSSEKTHKSLALAFLRSVPNEVRGNLKRWIILVFNRGPTSFFFPSRCQG
jgi:hypothetical protein